MARRPRMVVDGDVYHVHNRVSNGRPISVKSTRRLSSSRSFVTSRSVRAGLFPHLLRRYLTVRRARRGENTQLGAVNRRPQQKLVRNARKGAFSGALMQELTPLVWYGRSSNGGGVNGRVVREHHRGGAWRSLGWLPAGCAARPWLGRGHDPRLCGCGWRQCVH